MIGGLQADQSTSFQITQRRLQQFVNIIGSDPDVQTVVAFVGGGARRGQRLHADLAEAEGRARRAPSRSWRALRPQLAPRHRRQPVPAAGAGPAHRRAAVQRQLPVHAGGRQPGRPAHLGDQADRRDEDASRRSRTSTPTSRTMACRASSPSTGTRPPGLGLTNGAIDNVLYDAFGQRHVSIIYKDVNQYHVVMEVGPQYAQDPTALNNIYVSSGRGAPTPPTGRRQGPDADRARDAGGQRDAADHAHGRPRGLARPSPTDALPGLAAGPAARRVSNAPAAGATAAAVSGPSAPPARAASTGVAVSSTPESDVPLSAIATWADGSTPTSVNHQDTQPATTISFNLAAGQVAQRRDRGDPAAPRPRSACRRRSTARFAGNGAGVPAVCSAPSRC